jgi:hypothetical protein
MRGQSGCSQQRSVDGKATVDQRRSERLPEAPWRRGGGEEGLEAVARWEGKKEGAAVASTL